MTETDRLNWITIMTKTAPLCTRINIRIPVVHIEGQAVDRWAVFEGRQSDWYKNPLFANTVWLN